MNLIEWLLPDQRVTLLVTFIDNCRILSIQIITTVAQNIKMGWFCQVYGGQVGIFK